MPTYPSSRSPLPGLTRYMYAVITFGQRVAFHRSLPQLETGDNVNMHTGGQPVVPPERI